MRLLHQSMTELEHLPDYRTGLESHAVDVLADRVEVTVRGLRPGTYAGEAPSDVLGYPYAYHLVLEQAIDAARTAEREGFDGFVIGSFSEPFLAEIRSAVEIPVASMAEASLLVSCSLGTRIALIANGPAVRTLVVRAVDKHHLWDRVAAVSALEPAQTEQDLAAADRVSVAGAFADSAGRLVAHGADIVVPAEGVLAEIVRSQGLVDVDGAPVLDALAATWHHAEMLVHLARTGLGVSRRAFPHAPASMVDALQVARGTTG